MANKIQFRRGLQANLPLLSAGEPALCTDTSEVYIGTGTVNLRILKDGDTTISSVLLEKATGTGTAIALSSVDATADGESTTFIASANNNAAATTINSKPLYKPNTTTAPSIVAGKAYTIWYDATGDCFFIKASAEGNIIAAHALAGDIFSNDDDVGIPGTMPNRGAVNQALSINSTYIIPEGYHNGSGQVTQNIPTKGIATITPGTTNQTIAANQYLTGIQTILGDPDLIAANILTGKNIFGVDGNVVPLKSASGDVTTGSTIIKFAAQDEYPAIVTGLTFKPKVIVLGADDYAGMTSYHVVFTDGTDWSTDAGVQDISFRNASGGVNVAAQDSTYKVTSTGFTLPFIYPSFGLHWIALG